MTYHNRLLTTPYYINNTNSPFWNLVAYDTAQKIGENCCHIKQYSRIRIRCYSANNKVYCSVSCVKCNRVFHRTQRILKDMIGYFGF